MLNVEARGKINKKKSKIQLKMNTILIDGAEKKENMTSVISCQKYRIKAYVLLMICDHLPKV